MQTTNVLVDKKLNNKEEFISYAQQHELSNICNVNVDISGNVYFREWECWEIPATGETV